MPKLYSSDCNPNLVVQDIPVNQSKSTWVRLVLPKCAIESSSPTTITKLPLLIYIHGGGFVTGSAASATADKFYSTFTSHFPMIILSIEYRLAPEHRLPAAYEDCLEVLQWIKNSQDEFLTKYADLSNSFLMGSSAGSNIAFHVGLKASSCTDDDLKPLRIKGLILHQPFFGGTKRTESELRAVNDKKLPPCVTDICWELSLPAGVDRDHEFSNPALRIKSGEFDQIKDLVWKVLVTGYDCDPLYDRQVEVVKMFEENEVSVVAKFAKGGYHGADTFEFAKLKELCNVVKEFIRSILDVTS